MRVFAAPFKGRGRNAAVAVALELDAASLGLEDRNGVLSGKVDVRYLATDAKRKVFPELAHSASVEVKSDPPGLVPLERIRVRVVSELELPQGRYQLRVAAGSTLVAGNVVYDLEVPDLSDGPLAMSGVMLISPSEPMVLTLNSKSGAASSKAVKCYSEQCKAPVSTNVADVPLTPSITEPLLRDGTPGSPTTLREFGAGDQLGTCRRGIRQHEAESEGPAACHHADHRPARRGWQGDSTRLGTASRDDLAGHGCRELLQSLRVDPGCAQGRLCAAGAGGVGRRRRRGCDA